MLRAALFDFDGLILDTETPEVQTYREIYAEHGQDFPDEVWTTMIGISSPATSELPWVVLEKATGPLDRALLHERSRTRRLELIALQTIQEGVHECLEACERLGLRKAVVSSSRREWVEGHLSRLNILHRFEGCVCGHEGLPSKPASDLYKRCMLNMELSEDEAVAIEDSPNGIAAASGAGLYTIAVPNALTAQLDLSRANCRLNSLADIDWDALVSRFGSSGQ